MSWQRWFTLALLFCVDVRVKASESHPAEKSCWGRTLPCAVEASGSRRVIKEKEILLSMSPHALVEQQDAKTVQLVSGQFYVDTESAVVFKTPFARVWCDGDCKGIFIRSTEALMVKSIAGKWLAERTGDRTVYVVPEAMQMSFGEVTDDGMALMEFPQSLPWDATVKIWAALYPDKLKEFKEATAEFREVWKEAVVAVSELHHKEASRTIASHEKSLADARASAAAKEREDAKLRSLFRDKNP